MMLTSTWAEQDLRKHEQEQDRWLASRPVCDLCGEPIQDEVYYEPEPGACYCAECFGDYVHDNIMRYIPETE